MESGILGEAPALATAYAKADTIEEFKQAASLRLSSARKLGEAAGNDLKNWSDACYLGGYVVEMLLKAAIVLEKDKERFGELLPEPRAARCSCQADLVCSACGKKPPKHPYNKYKTHEIEFLMKELEASPRFSNAVAQHQEHFCAWDSEVRYSFSHWLSNPEDARQFLKHVIEFDRAMRNGGLGASA